MLSVSTHFMAKAALHGSIRMLHSQGHWSFDEAQRPTKLVGICQDVTERKRAEQQLRAANTALADAIRNCRICNWTCHALTGNWTRPLPPPRGKP